MAGKGGRRPQGREADEGRPRWSPLAYALLGASAILFIACTLPALKGERGVRHRHRRLVDRRARLERLCGDLEREVRSLREDPQTRKVRLDRLVRELGPPPPRESR